MKSILLTSTALVMVAGIAAADGHSSLSWSGSATAGLARNGGAEAVAAVAAVADTAAITRFITMQNAVAQGYGFTNAVVGAVNVTIANPVGTAAITVAEAASIRKAIVDGQAREIVTASGSPTMIAAVTAVRIHNGGSEPRAQLADSAPCFGHSCVVG